MEERFPMRPVLVPLFSLLSLAAGEPPAQVSETTLPTGLGVQPAGDLLFHPGRPLDLVLTEDGATACVQNGTHLLLVDVKTWTVRQSLPYAKGHGSPHGMVRVGPALWVSLANGYLQEVRLEGGIAKLGRCLALPGADKDSVLPCGLAPTADGQRLVVAFSRHNELGVVDLASGQVVKRIPVGVAPYGVAVEGDRAYVTNWGGSRPRTGEATAPSSGTEVAVDAKGFALRGTVTEVDLAEGRALREVEVGLHPSRILLDRGRLFVANANGDSVSILAASTMALQATVGVKPDPALPFGSIPNAMALSPEGDTLYVANAGNNAVAQVSLKDTPRVEGFIPTGWFPSALLVRSGHLFVASAKGDGSRETRAAGKRHVRWERGLLQKVSLPGTVPLARMTETVQTLARTKDVLSAFQPGASTARPVPVPRRTGEPSVFKHVVYVIKENRTYDQVFGDLRQGDGDPALCLYPREVTPNHHALAERWVLLDNYYCNGVVSADGHQWATQGITSAYQERMFGDWTRSYDFGSDPLCFAPTPFLWDQALLRGRSFRNYGEFDFPSRVPEKATWMDYYQDHRQGLSKVTFRQSVPLAPLRAYTSPTFPGWEMQIPDVVRVEAFLKELKDFEAKGSFPNLVLVYLPQDHTQGLKEGVPTPRAHLADNDLALGRLIEGLSRSRFWKETVVFVNEDDPQDGFDHVDGHRSLCLVASPYTKRGAVVSHFYNQGSVLHTIARILGMPPLSQLDAAAPTMEACFTDQPDFTPYTTLPNRVPLDELNPPSTEAFKKQAQAQSAALDLSAPDRISDDLMNRILWIAEKGTAPYPAHLAGAHGKGLKKRRLVLGAKDEDDD